MDMDKFMDTKTGKLIAALLGKQNHHTSVLWAASCAEHVLIFFEEKNPEDKRPRKAIEAGRAWVRGEIGIAEAREAAFEAHAASRDAGQLSAGAAARAAGYAAATADIPGHAVHAGTYAAKAAAFAAANKDIVYAATEKERSWQYEQLLYIKR